MDCSPPGSSSMEFSRQEYWSGLPFLSPGDLPDPGIGPRSPSLQAGSLPAEPGNQGVFREEGRWDRAWALLADAVGLVSWVLEKRW